MGDVRDFIGERLDEVETAARAATPGRWEAWSGATGGGGEYVTATDSGYTFGIAEGYTGRFDLAAKDATHIAMNDPAFVLAWVAGIRAVVALHAEVKIPGYEDEAGCCNTCDGVPDWPCSTVSAIAAIWPASPADPDREDR